MAWPRQSLSLDFSEHLTYTNWIALIQSKNHATNKGETAGMSKYCTHKNFEETNKILNTNRLHSWDALLNILVATHFKKIL